MTILHEIQAWGSGLPDWQQDAIVRLFANPKLSAQDDSDLYALLKSAHGIEDPDKRVPKKLSAILVAPDSDSEKVVKLLSINDLKNVNALAENESLPLASEGLTVIYGDNGAGKSGYSRALKKACRARDQSEEILPDAKNAPGASTKAQGKFSVAIDGAPPNDLHWIDGNPPPVELSAIAIFDALCARSYLDSQGYSWYTPYGLDILSGLAELCNRLKTKATSEQTENDPQLSTFIAIAPPETTVGKLLLSLTAKTKAEEVTALANLTHGERQTHEQMATSLREYNPAERAKGLRLVSSRIDDLASRCVEKAGLVSADAVNNLKKLVDASKASKEAADLAALLFRQTPGQLAGTGGDAWQEMFNAARKFATESHPHLHYPELGPKSLCPLCQQPLESGADRLIAFETFLNNETEKKSREQRKIAIGAYEPIKKADMSIGMTTALRDEMKGIDEKLLDKCVSFEAALVARVISIKRACGAECDWLEVGEPPENPAPELSSLAATYRLQAQTLDAASDPVARASLEAQFKELDARVKLEPWQQQVLVTIAKLELQGKLTKCISAVKTTTISAKASDLSEKVVTQELATALNSEFTKLSAGGLFVTIKSSSVKGKTQFKLSLQLPGQQRPASVLSEGEQRAIAIGSFLAEVNISGMKGGIVFDDPVSSLDHKRRLDVAKRLVEEGKKRQVIIFTHDLYFLCHLQQLAESNNVPLLALALRKTSKGYGVASAKLPFDGATSKTRAGLLKQAQVVCQNLLDQGDESESSEKVSEAYFNLRLAWERSVEEVLLSESVQRFNPAIQTQRLRGVEVTDEDYAAVEAGMSKCSIYSHDGASSASVEPPSPAELLADILKFEAWCKALADRRLVTIKRRKN